jgi:hypothetical protein
MMAADSRCRVANLPKGKIGKAHKPNNTADHERLITALTRNNRATSSNRKYDVLPYPINPTTPRVTLNTIPLIKKPERSGSRSPWNPEPHEPMESRRRAGTGPASSKGNYQQTHFPVNQDRMSHIPPHRRITANHVPNNATSQGPRVIA